jgi:hypothetical protein
LAGRRTLVETTHELSELSEKTDLLNATEEESEICLFLLAKRTLLQPEKRNRAASI